MVYVDNDPIVLRHAEALLRGSTEGAARHLQADVRDPDTILGRARPRIWTSATRPTAC